MFRYLVRLCKRINERKATSSEAEKIKNKIQKSTIQIMSIDETLDWLEEGKSIARFGDGELDLILGKAIGFQSANERLGESLKNILSSKPENCLIAVPDAISTLNNLTEKSLDFWIPNMAKYREIWVGLLTRHPEYNYRYGNAHISRCYIRYKDKSNSKRWFERLMNVWSGRDVVIVEGEKTKLGCGNDFLKTAGSVRRIIAPAENAFAKKDEIQNFILNNIEKSAVIILALGPTATVLAYELAQQGYQALDIGHCDIEYEWYRMGVMEKVAVKGKYTNEVSGGKFVEEDIVDEQYLKEVIKKLL